MRIRFDVPNGIFLESCNFRWKDKVVYINDKKILFSNNIIVTGTTFSNTTIGLAIDRELDKIPTKVSLPYK